MNISKAENTVLIEKIVLNFKKNEFLSLNFNYADLDNLSIIIPTHNRTNYLKRVIEYYKPLKIKKIICDSSDNRSSLDFYDFSYYHLPNLTFPEKIKFALEQINTEYVSIVPDDDFIFYESLKAGTKFLEQNRDFVFYTGRFLGYLLENKEFKLNEIYNTHIYTDNKYEDINLRTKDFFENYYITLWGIYKIEAIKKSYEIIDKLKIPNDNFIEFIIGLVLAQYGNLKVDREIFGVRESTLRETWGRRHIGLNKEKEYFFNLVDQEIAKNFKYNNFEEGKKGYFRFIKRINKKRYLRLIKEKIKNVYRKIFIEKVDFKKNK